jgi:hypothetical protein
MSDTRKESDMECEVTIRMDARVWQKFCELVLIEKGEALANIEQELVRAHDARDAAGINDNPLNSVTRSLVHLVHGTDSLQSGAGDGVWDVLVRLVAAADPACDRRYSLAAAAKPSGHEWLGKRARVRSLPDHEEFYHLVVGVSNRLGQTLVTLADDYGTFVPEVLAVDKGLRLVDEPIAIPW